MFDRVLVLSVLTLHTIFAGMLLVYFDANTFFVMAILSGLPIVALWQKERLRTSLVLPLLFVAIGTTVLVEIFAYQNGLWYEVSPIGMVLFGLFPIEAFLAAFVHILYFIVVYEFFFDDRKTSTERTFSIETIRRGVGIILATLLAYLYTLSDIIISYGFAWLVAIGAGVMIIGAVLSHRARLRVFLKTSLFALVLLPMSLAYEYVLIMNDLRFFANFNEYIYTFSLFGARLPFEEIVFIILAPLAVATLYELYFDDAS